MTLPQLREQVRELLVASIRPGSGEDNRRHLIEEAISNNANSEDVFTEFLYIHNELLRIVPIRGFRTRFESDRELTRGIGFLYSSRSRDEYKPPILGSVLLTTTQNWLGYLKLRVGGQQAPPTDMYGFVLETKKNGEPITKRGYYEYQCTAIVNRQLSDFYIDIFRDGATRIMGI